MKLLQRLAVTGFGFFCFLLFSQAVWPQDFSSVHSDLQLLEDLINDTISNTQEQQKLLDGLRENLNESGNLIAAYETIMTEQGSLLTELQIQLNEMYETYKTQSALYARSEQRLKSWKIFTIIAIPAAALISGGIVWAVSANSR